MPEALNFDLILSAISSLVSLVLVSQNLPNSSTASSGSHG